MSLNWQAFDALRSVLAAQGFNVIPLPPAAKGAAGSGVGFKRFNKPRSKRTGPGDRRYWERAFDERGFSGHVNAYLLTASGFEWCYVVVDVDDPAFDARAVEVFGDSPLFVSRSGRVRHRYFRVRTEDYRSAHLMGAFGRRSVDVIVSTGVVAPGSVHEDGEVYTLSIPLEDWTEDWVEANVPFLDLDAVDKLRREKHGAKDGEVIQAIPVEGSAEGFVHLRRPIIHATGSQMSGHVFPATIIQTLEGPKPLHSIPHGTRCFATYRDDAHPSASISRDGGSVYFWDHSRGMYWKMLDARSAEEDPELPPVGSNYFATLERALEDLGVEVEIVGDDGFLSDQMAPLDDNETVFLIAPHGSGKTILAKREHDRAKTSLSVCNTQALTIANAAVLGLKAVYDGVDEIETRGSVCIPSLHRYDTAPEFFHVDEADAVHGFLHSGIVEEPLTAWKQLAAFASESTRCLIASADLSFEDIALFSEAIRSRNPGRALRAVIRIPQRSRCRLLLRHISKAKEALHIALVKPRDTPIFVGISTRKLAGQIAQGYRVANNLPTIDLHAVAALADAVDSPSPYPLQSVRDELIERGAPDASVERPFFVSGENNRFDHTVRWLENTDDLVRSHDLIVASPAVQSGVSLDPPVSAVFILHENRNLPADAVLQIARRARNPQDTDIVLGVKRWKPEQHRTDRVYLDDLVHKRSGTTIYVIRKTFPSFAADHETAIDSEFLWSWRIRTRRLIRSYADPIGEIVLAARRHGWRVDVDLEDDGDGSAFNEITAAAKGERDRLNAETTADAADIDDGERKKLEAAARLKSGERQKLDRHVLEEFYSRPVTPDLVTLDAAGRYRGKVRAYTHARFILEDLGDIVAYLDHARGKGRQPTERPHNFTKAILMADLMKLAGEEFNVGEIRDPVRAWWKQHRSKMRVFFPKMKGPKKDFEAQWIGSRLRSLGAVIVTQGKSNNRRKIVTFDVVDDHAEAYAARLFDLFTQKEAEEWRTEWKTKIS